MSGLILAKAPVADGAWIHWLDIVSALLILSGLLFFVGASIGLVRFPDFYTRMHAAGKGDTLSTVLITAGMAVQVMEHFSLANWLVVLVALKILAIGVFIMLTSPTSTHALMLAGYDDGIEPITKPDRKGIRDLGGPFVKVAAEPAPAPAAAGKRKAAKKASAKKSTRKKAGSKKTASKKTASKKVAAKKTAKKASRKKVAKKVAVKKVATKKTASKKTAKKTAAKKVAKKATKKAGVTKKAGAKVAAKAARKTPRRLKD